MKIVLLIFALLGYAQTAYCLGSRQTPDTSTPLDQYVYKDNYVLFLSNRSDIKFQFSFKVQLFSDVEQEEKGILNRMYFGFTQKSVWDTFKDSSPFEDHNFNPELFWCQGGLACGNRLDTTEDSDVKWRLGAEHESNGQAGAESRSWNRAYARLAYSKELGSGTLVLAPKVWYIINESSNNSDIADYLGYFDLELLYSFNEGANVGATVRHGSKEGSIQIDVAMSIDQLLKPFGSSGWKSFNPNLYLQYFSGYGENLLNYNQHRDVIRLGFRFYQ